MKQMTESARALAAENMPLVPFTLRRYLGCTGQLDEDLVSEGYIGLCKAATYYKQDSGIRFSTYAVMCILDYLRNRHKVSSATRRHPKQPPVSLNTHVLNDDGEISELLNILEDSGADTERAALDHILLQDVVGLLPLTSAINIFGYRGTEIAERMNVSKQRVHYLRYKELKHAERVLLERHILDPETVALQKEGS